MISHLLIVSGLLSATLSAPVNTSGTPPLANQFVQRQELRFFAGGQEHFVVSANYWQAMNLGAVNSAFGNRTRLLQDLDKFVQLGINNLRIMASSEGPDNTPFRMSPTLLKSPHQYDEAVFEGLDFALAEMGKRGIRAVMCLNNEWHWSGGFSQYVSWITNSTIPYPPSWDPSLKTYTQGDWGNFINYANRFYNDAGINDRATNMFRSHVTVIMNRKNKFNGLIYKDDPTIFSWELANEPQNPPRWWVDNIGSLIKSISPKHLVTIGLESKNDEWDYRSSHESEYVDYATIHVWAQNAGIYDMLNPSEDNLRRAIDWATGNLNKVEQWSRSLGKPLILEEFGLARDNFEAATQSEWYAPNHTTKNRDRYYDALLQNVAASHRNGGAFAGFGFWAYAGAARPGDRFISDPPHEAPGWYAVYDTDVSTFDVIKKAAKAA